jgi:cellulose synthase/poly-beta-1,6-N-acetylglucosamine synthase-like glycosyltransferase
VIYRRSALDACGGIAQVADSEDLFTSLHLLEHKYTVFFLDEPLASGLGPTTLIAFCNQQHRWARGGLRMLFKHPTLLNRKLSAEQRVQFFLSNCFYLSGISLSLSLINPFLAILLNIKPIADGATFAWATAYIPYLAMNFGTSFLLMKRYRGQALALGILSFAPYLSALRATLIGRAFQWKITNQASKGLITRLLAPHIIYLTLAITTGAFLFTGAIPYDPALRLYYGWLALDSFLILVCIFAGYTAPSRVSVPAFTAPPPDIHTAEIVLVTVPSQRTAIQFSRYQSIEETPTLRLNGVHKES